MQYLVLRKKYYSYTQIKIINSNLKEKVNYKDNPIIHLFQKLSKKEFVSNILQVIEHKNEVIYQKFNLSNKILPKNLDEINKKWILAFHGIRSDNLELIVE